MLFGKGPNCIVPAAVIVCVVDAGVVVPEIEVAEPILVTLAVTKKVSVPLGQFESTAKEEVMLTHEFSTIHRV
ncbi:hypothetical protein FLGE108171_15965 [Flavobacterium gelidilacus]